MVLRALEEKALQELRCCDFMSALQLHEFGDFINRFNDTHAFRKLGARLMIMAKYDGFSDHNFPRFGIGLLGDQFEQRGLS